MIHKGTWTWWVGILVVLLGVGLLAMRRTSISVSAAQNDLWRLEPTDRDLDSIRGDTLRVLVINDPLTWEERPGATTGLEWELLQRYARKEGLALLAIPMDDLDSMVLALQQGKGDVIAAQVTPRRDRRKWVAFTDAYRMVRPVLATLRPDPIANKDHSGMVITNRNDTAEVSAWSPFADPDYRFDGENRRRLPLHMDPLITPEDLLIEVVLGRHGATIVTDARAAHEAGRFPVIEFSDAIGPAQPLCFAVRRNARRLLKSMNAWLQLQEEREARTNFVKAYASRIPRSGPLRTRKAIPVSGDSISPYDGHFQEHAGAIAWEWELLAAMAYKESRFDSTVVSRMGAQGIMQIMPGTARGLGLSPEDDMGEHVRAAAEYLSRLDMMWKRQVPDRDQRLRFVLASYNAGPGHIIDAQRLAEKLGLDPGRWEHNVERAVLLKAKPRYYMLPEMKNGYCIGSQVFHYVRDVVAMYRQLKSRPRTSSSREDISFIPDSAGI
jgi:membrane-bound lytic murein transglycosylase F